MVSPDDDLLPRVRRMRREALGHELVEGRRDRRSRHAQLGRQRAGGRRPRARCQRAIGNLGTQVVDPMSGSGGAGMLHRSCKQLAHEDSRILDLEIVPICGESAGCPTFPRPQPAMYISPNVAVSQPETPHRIIRDRPLGMLGIVLFGEAATPGRLISLGLIVAGIVGLKLASTS